jgi:hypothetical protein
VNRHRLSGKLLAVVGLSSTLSSAQSLRGETGGEVAAYGDSDNVWVLTPTARGSVRGADLGASATYTVDIVSAASVDIVSTASPRWTEVRHAGSLAAGYQPGNFGASGFLATSIEPDFVSTKIGASASADLARKNLSLSLGYAYEHDVAGRTGTPYSVYALKLDRHEISASALVVVGRATTLTSVLDLSFESGRQEKPYRFLPLFDAAVAAGVPVGASVDEVNRLRLPGKIAERLPDTRQRAAASLRLMHRLEGSTLTVLDRVYFDGWGQLANTTDLKWVFELSRRWSLWPHLRFHEQSAASFWRRAYVGRVVPGQVVAPEYRSGDRELGPLRTLTAGPGAAFDFGSPDPRRLSVTLEVEGSATDFRDALYIDRRWAGLVVAGFTARFE